MVFPVIQAYIGDITTETREGFTMGLFNMSAFVGLSIGPLMGGVINEIYGIRAAFAIMGIMAGIGLFTNMLFLPPRSREKISSRNNLFIGWKTLLFQKPIVALFIYRFAFTACIGIVWGFLPVYASNSFSLNSSYIGILVTLGVFISGVLQTPMGYIADRYNRNRMVIFGGLFISLSLIYFERSTTIWGLYFSNILFGLGGGISTAPHNALAVVAGNQNRAMGTVMSLMITGHSLGILIGSLIAGAAMDYFQLGKAFSMGAGVMVVGVALFFVLGHSRWGSAA
jgi:MFS family permease